MIRFGLVFDRIKDSWFWGIVVLMGIYIVLSCIMFNNNVILFVFLVKYVIIWWFDCILCLNNIEVNWFVWKFSFLKEIWLLFLKSVIVWGVCFIWVFNSCGIVIELF